MSDLSRYKFSGLQLCKLVGISHHQFQSFKLAGLIENKPKYTLNNVIYVGISNVFRMGAMSWLNIFNLYTEVFGDPKIFLDLIDKEPFYKVDFINLYINDKRYELHLKDEKRYDIYLKNELTMYKKKKDIPMPGAFSEDPDIIKYIYFSENDYEYTKYIVYVYKVLDKIIENSKHLSLKVDVEKILLSV